MADNTFQYPSVVSRTLDPTGKSLLTVVGLHDHELSDADINLIQDLQRLKRDQLSQNSPATSGCLTWQPMTFDTTTPNALTIPGFDILFSGEVVSITGSDPRSILNNQAVNSVVLPAPAFWNTASSDEPARIYVVFLELWYQSLDPTKGATTGYYVDPVTGQNYFYPYGCVTPSFAFLESVPDDSVDIFNNGLSTTQRAQIQWRLNVQRVSLTYDFTRYRYGLDPVGLNTNQAVYAQAGQVFPVNSSGASYQFQNLGPITGDTGLWRAGDGNPTNLLGTMDGYSYAMPVAVVFQRNFGGFSTSNNIFGCADPQNLNASGLLQFNLSGRFDARLADQIYPDDTVDTRQTVSFDSWEYDKLVDEGFVDLITGNLRSAIGRGQSPGMSTAALGSALDYYVSVAPPAAGVINTVGQFDGFFNGFSSDQRTFFVSKQITINNKSVGTNGAAWALNDAFTISLPSTTNATITSVFVQGFNTSSSGVKTPINLLGSQILIVGVNSKTIVVSFPNAPVFSSGSYVSSFDPGVNNIYVHLGVTYPAGGSTNLVKNPIAIDGGSLYDSTTGVTMPVYGISEYALQARQLTADFETYQLWTTNPAYSSVQFGTRAYVKVPGSSGIQQTVAGSPVTTFVVSGLSVNGNGNGIYIVNAFDLVSGVPYSVISRTISGSNCIITIQGGVVSTSTMVVEFLAYPTAQVSYNAPVRGVTNIEETVLFGNYIPSLGPFRMDPRVTVEAVSFDNTTNASTVVLGANGCFIDSISGDDTVKMVWVLGQGNNLNAVQISTAEFNNGLVTVVVPGVNLDITNGGSYFFFVGAIHPAFDQNSIFTVEERYIPYQGEGRIGHNYEILYTIDNALITTNGTGAAPVVGLSDVYPYNRELPISISLPSQVNWADSTLTNTPLSTLFDNNYVAMRQNNVETTLEAPLHVNDFILPMNKDIRKVITLLQGGSGGRGFAQSNPHLGFAITAPTPRTVLGQNLQSTTAPIVLYVNNVSGNDSNSGLDPSTAKLTITAAVATLPPVLRHPCSVQLVTTGVPYTIANISTTMQVIALGDGSIRTAKWYALANLAFSIQEEGRVVITSTATATSPIIIDATGWAGFGDGPTSAFFMDNSRVLFNNIQFQGFVNPAVYGIDSDVEFINCVFQNNTQAGGFEQGCGVIISGGSISLPNYGNGFVMAQSELTVSGVALIVPPSVTPGSFFIAERGSCINLTTHSTAAGQETNISPSTVVAYAQLNSNIVADGSFQTKGEATLTANSVLSRSATIDPFLGGITKDSTSSVVTQI
jgi:hypothetical protein